MFIEGTLVPTNRGIIPIEEFGFARKKGEKSECKSNIMLKTYDGEWNRCIFQVHQRLKGIKIKIESNFSIICSEDQKILTVNGLKNAKEIKVGDEIFSYIDTYINKNTYFPETEKIGYVPKKGNDIYIPKRMTEELASICGILISPSTIIRINNDDKLVISCKDRITNKILIRYIRDIFQTKQKMVIQDDQYCRIFSPYIIDYLENLCGLDHKTQKVHSSLMQSNRGIQMSFLNGLIMAEEENITGSLNFSYLYRMDSKIVSDQIEALLCLYGYRPFVKAIKRQKTICIRKPVTDFFSDKLLDKMKKNQRQIIETVKSVQTKQTGNYYGIICEKENYVIKNLVFGE